MASLLSQEAQACYKSLYGEFGLIIMIKKLNE